MAKITRKQAKIFGSTAGANQRSQIGSLAAGSPQFTTDPNTMQALAAYATGWYNIVVGADSPPIEDMNSFCYLMSYQVAYLMQEGVAEWDAATTYYLGSIVNNAGTLLVSLINNNTNAITDPNSWISVGSSNVQVFTGDSTWVCPSGVHYVEVFAEKFPIPMDIATGNTTVAIGAAVAGTGSVFSWGGNGFGQLGQNLNPIASAATSTPALVQSFTGLNAPVIKVSSGNTCAALTSTGFVYVWGQNQSGQLGQGDLLQRSNPTIITPNFLTRKIATCQNSGGFFALTASGDTYAWGNNSGGRLGVGDIVGRSTPTLVVGGYKFVDIYSNTSTTCAIALDASGNAYGWGPNGFGVCGTGDVIARSSPTLVVGSHAFSKLFGRTNTVFGLTTAGDLYAWGSNTAGELGVGDVLPRSSPTLVLGGHKFVSVSVGVEPVGGKQFVVALDTSGAAWAWGDGTMGQLGTGNVTTVSSPVAVIGSHVFARVLAQNTGASVYGIDSSGNMYTWGGNVGGQLGLGDVLARSSPVLVSGGTLWQQTFPTANSTGGPGVLALDQSGVVWAWGSQLLGELGLNNDVAVSTPTIVTSKPVLAVTPYTATQVVPVTPGVTYKVNVASYFAGLAGYPLLAGGADKVTLKW